MLLRSLPNNGERVMTALNRGRRIKKTAAQASATPNQPRRHQLRKARLLEAIISLTVLLALSVGSYFIDRIAAQDHRQQLRDSVRNELSIIRAQLEGNINANVQLARGMVSAIANQPQMDQQRFAQLAAPLFEGEHQLRHLGARFDAALSLPPGR